MPLPELHQDAELGPELLETGIEQVKDLLRGKVLRDAGRLVSMWLVG